MSNPYVERAQQMADEARMTRLIDNALELTNPKAADGTTNNDIQDTLDDFDAYMTRPAVQHTEIGLEKEKTYADYSLTELADAAATATTNQDPSTHNEAWYHIEERLDGKAKDAKYGEEDLLLMRIALEARAGQSMKRPASTNSAIPKPVPEASSSQPETKEKLKLSVASLSVRGWDEAIRLEQTDKYRDYYEQTENQDNLLVDEARKLFIVSDGVGGGDNGSVASKLVVKAFEEESHLAGENYLSTRDIAENFQAGLQQADFNLAKFMQDNGGTMGATVIGARIVGDKLVWVNAGDSAIGVLRNGAFNVLSSEQCVGNRLTNGIWGSLARRPSPVDADVSPSKSKDEIGIFDLEAGDRIVLMSDGIMGDWENQLLDESEYVAALSNNSAEEAALALKNASKKVDDTTVVVVDIN